MIEKGEKWDFWKVAFCSAGGNGRKPSDRAVRGQFVRGSHERVREETRPKGFRRTDKCLYRNLSLIRGENGGINIYLAQK